MMLTLKIQFCMSRAKYWLPGAEFEDLSLQGLLATCPSPEIKLVSALGYEFRNYALCRIYTVLHLVLFTILDFFTLRSSV